MKTPGRSLGSQFTPIGRGHPPPLARERERRNGCACARQYLRSAICASWNGSAKLSRMILDGNQRPNLPQRFMISSGVISRYGPMIRSTMLCPKRSSQASLSASSSLLNSCFRLCCFQSWKHTTQVSMDAPYPERNTSDVTTNGKGPHICPPHAADDVRASGARTWGGNGAVALSHW
jgi:hypothetical protein